MDIWQTAENHENRIEALEEELAEMKQLLAGVRQRLVDMDPVLNAQKRMRQIWSRKKP
jgi:uncharacterized coiled-coil protein SlyX